MDDGLSSFQGRSSSASSEGTDCGKQTVGNSLQLTDCGSFLLLLLLLNEVLLVQFAETCF